MDPPRPNRLVLAGAVVVAAVLDAVENTALLRVLGDYATGGVGVAAPAIANVAALLKFGILGVAALYVVVMLVALGLARLRHLRR